MTEHAEPRPQPQTLSEMESRRDVVEEEIAALRAKLDRVRAVHHITGRYCDADWYRRATTRLRFTGLEHQRLCRAIAAIKREQRQAQAVSVERAFVEIARGRLDVVEFDTIMAKARATAE